jgi:predicted RNA binding protein with dsRBD fold (UPF0201 family)
VNDDADIDALNDACQHRYRELNELLRDHRIPWAAREVIEHQAEACMKAWDRLPKKGDQTVEK